MPHPYKWIRIIPQHEPRGAAKIPTIYDPKIEYGFKVELSREIEKPADDAQPSTWFGVVAKELPPVRPVPRVQGLIYQRTLELLDESAQAPTKQKIQIGNGDAITMDQLDEGKIAQLSGWFPLKRGGLSSYGSD